MNILKLLIPLVFFSCTKEVLTEVEVPLEGNLTQECCLSNYVSTSNYIQLESSKDCFIGKISKIKINDGKIYILDSFKAKSLFVFNTKGVFLSCIGTRGKGDSEYLFPQDFEVHNDTIFLLSDQKFISKYDLEGRFISKSKLPFSGQRILIDNKKIVLMQTIYNGKESFLLNVFDQDINLLSRHCKVELNPFFIQSYRYCYDFDGIKMYYSNFENKLYSLSIENKVSQSLGFKFPNDCIVNKSVMDNILETYNSREWSQKALLKSIWINNYIHTPAFDYINYFKKNKSHIAFYDHTNKKSKLMAFKHLNNDIDGVDVNFFYFDKNMGKSLVGIIYPADVLNELQDENIHFKGMTIERNDNPIVALYEVKTKL